MEDSLSACEDLTKELEETKQVITMLEGSLRDQQKLHRSEAQEFKALQTRFSQLEGEKESLLLQLDTLYKELSDKLAELKHLEKQGKEGDTQAATLLEKNKALEKSLAQEKDKVVQAERETEKKEVLVSSMKQRLASFFDFACFSFLSYLLTISLQSKKNPNNNSLQKATHNFEQLEADFTAVNKKLKATEIKLQDSAQGLFFLLSQQSRS